jgi:Ca2+-binding EF-hand superfamily protein
MEVNEYYILERDLRFLLLRFDKNNDGLISFAEFVQELTPKSPVKYF